MSVLNPATLIDGYKLDHRRQYPNKTRYVYSNWTPRTSRVKGQSGIIFFGLQYFIEEYLVHQFDEFFFSRPKEEVLHEYARRVNGYIGPNAIGTQHIQDLYELGYLPICIKALPEGSFVPLGVPALTIENTDSRFFWLVNYFETLMSCVMWMPSTSATTASRFRRTLEEYAKKTGSDPAFVDWQGHDFSFRGMPGPEAAASSGAAHLLFFTGTDTMPALDFIEAYYGDNFFEPYFEEGTLLGGSVAATEHSVMSAGGDLNELDTFNRLLELYPTGIVSVVSDTWDLWNVLEGILPKLKEKILARQGKLVIRPDSGDPVKILCGDPDSENPSARKGVVEILWELFNGSVSDNGYRILDSHIGVIYGDGINEERLNAILKGLADKRFASCNVVFGMGSFTYQYVTRDTYGWAMKATWAEVDGKGVDLFKDPITDDGGKRSAKGRLSVLRGDFDQYVLVNQATKKQEEDSLLETVYEDGCLERYEDFITIRERARKSLV